MLTRRDFLIASAAASAAISTTSLAKQKSRRLDATARIQALETGQARLGVCFLDTATGEVTGTRIEERFAMCSSFKLGMIAACLREADHGRLDLDEVLPYSESDMLEWAPVTRKNLAHGGMTIAALAQAAQEQSDGVAANLLVRRLGGPARVTEKFREMGDKVTRLDRYEPDLGLVLSADTRDTTSPLSMARLVRRVTTGDALHQDSRDRLMGWMISTKTGAGRLRAGVPREWRTGNKTGTGRVAGTTNKVNDFAITFPPQRSPIIIAAYFDSGEFTEQTESRHEAVLAEVGKIAAQWAISG